jgi:hypothetical protein
MNIVASIANLYFYGDGHLSSLPVAFFCPLTMLAKKNPLVTCLPAGWTDSTPDSCGTDGKLLLTSHKHTTNGTNGGGGGSFSGIYRGAARRYKPRYRPIPVLPRRLVWYKVKQMVPGRINFRVMEKNQESSLISTGRSITRRDITHWVASNCRKHFGAGLRSINCTVATTGHPAEVQAWDHVRQSDRRLVVV